MSNTTGPVNIKSKLRNFSQSVRVEASRSGDDVKGKFDQLAEELANELDVVAEANGAEVERIVDALETLRAELKRESSEGFLANAFEGLKIAVKEISSLAAPIMDIVERIGRVLPNQ